MGMGLKTERDLRALVAPDFHHVVELSDDHKEDILTAEHQDRIDFYLCRVVQLSDISRNDWKRQTDTLRLSFIAARMFADLEGGREHGSRLILVDGHINQSLKVQAIDSGNIKAFFNRRCHDYGIAGRRIIIYDTVTTRKMGGKGSSSARLHFHAAFELPGGWSQNELRRRLEKVFGRAEYFGFLGNSEHMGRRQFHFSKPDWSKHYSHNGSQASGPLGKIFYAIKHAGSSYRCLDLNDDGKRSRKAPAYRGKCNKRSSGIARGIASNFNKEVVFCDNVSKQAGEDAFMAWITAKRAEESRRKHSTRHAADEIRAAA